MRIQWICTVWRVVRSAYREPNTRLSVPSGPSPKASADHPDLADLGGGQEPAGHLDPHHEGVAALLLRIDAGPLQPLHLAGHLGDAGRALLRVGVDDGVDHLEGVAGQLLLLDVVELAAGSGRG